MGCAASFMNIVKNQHVNTTPELECDDCDAAAPSTGTGMYFILHSNHF